jgi:hypothetical protein
MLTDENCGKSASMVAMNVLGVYGGEPLVDVDNACSVSFRAYRSDSVVVLLNSQANTHQYSVELTPLLRIS